MRKVAMICSNTSKIPYERQGATQTYVLETTKCFKGYKSHLFSSALSGRPDKEIVENTHFYRIRSNFFNQILFGITKFRNPYYCYIYKVAREIKKLNIKVIHVLNRPLYMPYLRTLLGEEVKLILCEHNHNIADTLSQKDALKVLKSIDAYVGVSKFTMDFEITNKYPQFSNKSYYILNGVDVEKFKPFWERKEEANTLREKYNLQNSKIILFVGAIREKKGLHHLVRAMKKVILKYPKAKLVIAGGSSKNLEATDHFAKTVKKEAQELRANCQFLGFVSPSEIHKIYLLGDIFVGPSTWEEPFGLVFAEASASGLPVIASKKGGIPEIIDDGINGLLIDDPSNIDNLANKIIYLLKNSEIARKFGEAGRQKMVEKFSWERVAGETEDLYDKLIQSKRSN